MMKDSETLTLLAALRAAFPRHPFDEETASVYVSSLRDLNAECAQLAVKQLIREAELFPTIATIRDVHNRFRRTLPEPRALEEPRPSEEQRRETAQRMRAWATEHWGGLGEPGTVNVTEGLEELESGRCDDCGEPARLRWRYGKFALCHGCVTSRKRAAVLCGG